MAWAPWLMQESDPLTCSVVVAKQRQDLTQALRGHDTEVIMRELERFIDAKLMEAKAKG